ncbi:MAG TPA: MBL fold metallo-hydrolase [Kofleriaceae bacterium]|nr:MBL fold metallo-hydrolase [Kofleriaceae bacterium]
MRTLTSVLGNSQRLDGGAMFGNAPRAVWETWIPPDDRNRIPLACRCLLIREESRTILLETGIGAFFEPKLRERFGVVEDRHVLLESLAAEGVNAVDVDVIVLSHLHFDHAGGILTQWSQSTPLGLAFPRAQVVVGAEAWARAKAPHPRDRASFIPELVPLLEDRVEIVEGDTSRLLGDGYRFHRSNGHTPGLLLTEIAMPGGPIVFAADLIPGRPWVHLPITMGYDRYPELLIDEKTALLTDLVARGGRLFFTHDPEIAMSKVARDERGRFGARDDVPSFRDLAA